MKRKAEQVISQVVERVSEWDAVDTVTVLESGEDYFDPYFFFSLDLYCRGDVPAREVREAAFEDAFAFESLTAGRKDRFVLNDIPIRLEYKDIDRFDSIIEAAVTDGAQPACDSGTFMFYRLTHARVLKQRSDWLDDVKKRVEHLSESFWEGVRHAAQARMEHFLSDLYAAVVREDDLFFLVSSAGFIKSLCSVLFAINRRFEPSSRLLAEQVTALPVLPEPFAGRFESFLRAEGGLSPDKRYEVGELMARSVLAL